MCKTINMKPKGYIVPQFNYPRPLKKRLRWMAAMIVLFLASCQADPQPQTSVVFSFQNPAGDTNMVYSYGQKVTRDFQYTREFKSEPYTLNPGDSVSITASSSVSSAKVIVIIYVNGKERFSSFRNGTASVKGKL